MEGFLTLDEALVIILFRQALHPFSCAAGRRAATLQLGPHRLGRLSGTRALQALQVLLVQLSELASVSALPQELASASLQASVSPQASEQASVSPLASQ